LCKLKFKYIFDESFNKQSIGMEIQQFLGLLTFLFIFTAGFWLMLFLLTFVVPYWLTGNLIERWKENKAAKKASK
jgi:hypothetical protein